MPKTVRWFLIAIVILAVGRAAVLLDNQWMTYQQQESCRAQAKREFTIVTGESLPLGYPSHYDAVLGMCTFFFQSFPPKTTVPQNFWMNAVSGMVFAEENSPGDAFKETCFLQNRQVNCAYFETVVNQIMTQ